MPLTIAELQTELTGNSSQFDATLEAAHRKLITFGETDYAGAQLKLNTDVAMVALKHLRTEWETLKKEMSTPIPVGANGALPGSGSPFRPSTANPARVAATTAAAVEQIERTSNARRAQNQLLERSKTDAALERQTVLSTQRRDARIGQIEEEFWKRQGLREQAARARAGASSMRRVEMLRTSGMQDIRGGMVMSGAFTLPLVAGLSKIGRVTTEWESDMTEVRRTVTGTVQELDTIEKKLRQMAAGKNAIPVKASDLAEIAQAAGQLGIKTPAVVGFTKTIAALTVATKLTRDEAASELAKFANITQMSQANFDRLGSTLARLKHVGASTVQEVVAMGLRIAGAGHQVGMSEPQILGVANALTSLGIEAESGGSAFSRTLISISKASSKGSKELTTFAHVAGMSVGDFKKLFDRDATEAVTRFVEGLGQLKKGQIFQVLDALHLKSIRLTDTISRAAGAGKIMRISLEEGNKAWRENTALTDATNKVYATTASQLVIFHNRMDEVWRSIGDKGLPVVNKLIKSYGADLPQALGAAASAFESLPAGAQKAALGAVGILALVGPAKFATGNIKLLTAELQALWLAAAANPAVAVAAVLALAAGYVVLNKTFSNIAQAEADAKKNTDDLAGGFKRMLDVLPNGSKQALEITKIRDEVAAAGTDVDKLNQAAQDLAKTRARLNIEVKNPDMALVMSSEMDKAQAALDRQQLTATVIVRPFIEQAQRAVSDSLGLTNKDRPVWDNTIGDGGGESGGFNSWIDSLYATPDEPSGTVTIQPWEDAKGIEAALKSGSEHTKKLRAEAKSAEARQAFNNFQAHNSAVTGVAIPTAKPLLPVLGDGLATGRTANGEQTFVMPGAQATDATPAGVEAARKRLEDHKAKTAPKTPTNAAHPPTLTASELAAKDKEADKAARAAEAEKRRQEAAERHRESLLSAWRAKQAQALDESARPWEHLNETIGQMGLRLNEFDAATDGARARAKLLSKEFANLPKPIQDATVQMATLLDQVEEMGKQRDGLRDSNAGTLSQLLRSGAGIAPFLKAIHGQEGAYNFGGRIGDARGRASVLGNTLGSLGQEEAAWRNNRSKALREQNDTQRFEDIGEDLGEVGATSAAGARIAEVVARKQASGIAKGMVKRCEELAETTYWDAGVHDYDRVLAQKGSAKETLARFKKAGIGHRYVPGMALAPGGLLYSSTLGDGSGHVQEIGKDGHRYDQYGRDHIKESNFQWYVPPPGALSIAGKKADAGAQAAGNMAGLNAKQQATARTIMAVGRAMGASQKVITAALATALMESTMGLNVRNGHALGAFQQMPSWGSAASRMNVSDSAKRFMARAMAADSKHLNLSVNDLAQKVQASDKPNGYAKFEAQAGAILGAAPSSNAVQEDAPLRLVTKPAPKMRPLPKMKGALSGDNSPTRAKPGTGALLPYTEAELKSLLRAWGPIVTEGSERPGVSNGFRLQKQDDLLNRLANGERLSPARIKADRAAANVADASSARARTTTDAKRATEEMARATVNQIKVLGDGKRAFEASGGSMAAYERATFIAQKRIEAYSSEQVVALWNQKRFHEANALAAKQVSSAALIYDKEKGGDHAVAASRAATALADETGALNEQRDYLAQNAGKPESVIARGMDEISRSWAEYRRLIDEEGMEPGAAKALATQTAAQGSANAATREAIDLQRQLNLQQAQREDDDAAQNDDASLRGDGLNVRQRERELAGRSAERAKAHELEAAVQSGKMSPEFADASAWQAGEEARARFDQDARGKRDDNADADTNTHKARMELLSGQSDLNRRFATSDPELAIQLQLLERRNELNAQNKMLDDSEQIDVKARLDDYEAEIRAEDALSRQAVQRQAVQSAVENTLSLQKEHELAMAHTAAERLEIEQRFDELARNKRGEIVSPEEKAEQAKQRAQTTANAQFENFKNQAAQMRDLIAGSMDEGAKKGVGAILGHWATGLAEMMQKAAVTRVANKITKGIFGIDVSDESGDFLDVLNGKNGQTKGKKGRDDSTDESGATSTPGLSAIPSILDGLHAHRRAKSADGIDTAPTSVKRHGFLGGLLGGILGGGADQGSAGQNIQHATINIQTATENIQNATVYTQGGANGGFGNSPGSGPSIEQALHTMGLLH